MKVRKEWMGSKKAAKQGDLADLQEDLHLDLAKLSDKVDGVETELTDVKRNMATKDMLKLILDIVKQVDRRTKDWEHIPEDVIDLKNRVFRLEMKARRS